MGGELKGDRLYLNLSASQVRRRLKGHGFGVKKVQSAGRNQAVIIHTATGQHRRDLHALFHDVLAPSASELGVPIELLRNLGHTSARWLREAGIHTREELDRLGPARAYLLVKEDRPEVTLNLLWALAGALSDTDWRDLPLELKDRLRQEVDRTSAQA